MSGRPVRRPNPTRVTAEDDACLGCGCLTGTLACIIILGVIGVSLAVILFREAFGG